jgi:autoinducer 2 (AI-2) kinase
MGQAFSSLRGSELCGKTVGLLGLGAVGRAVARRLEGFAARVLVADPNLSREQAALFNAELVSLNRLLEESDFLSLHAGAGDQTRGLIGAPELARMKPGAFLINTARAALVDEEALLEALSDARLGGAALDVFAVEPPGADHPLLALDNVIATPHVGGNTREVAAHQGRIVVAELAALLRGESPRSLLNPSVMAGFDWTRPRPRPEAERVRQLLERPAPAVSDLQRDRPTSSQPDPIEAASTSRAPREITQAMERLAETFVREICEDAALRDFADGKQVALHFSLPDLGVEFHLALHDGQVSGALGAPQREADVRLRMRAATLDGMFRGTLNPMESAMQGEISFTGDAAKAMTLQHLQADLQRLYASALEQAGEPGDLSAVPDCAAGETAAPRPVQPGDLREQIVQTVRELFEAGLVTATGGNASARIPDSDEIWITPSQLFKGDLAPEVLVRIDLEGHPLDPGARSPSSEWAMHCALYRARPEVRAVVHAHATHATILANAGLPFLPISTEAAFFGDLARVPFIMPGSGELARAVAEAMGGDWAVLMMNHGLIVAGRSLRRAADTVEIIDRCAEIILGCRAVGVEPPTLPASVVATLREMGDLVA